MGLLQLRCSGALRPNKHGHARPRSGRKEEMALALIAGQLSQSRAARVSGSAPGSFCAGSGWPRFWSIRRTCFYRDCPKCSRGTGKTPRLRLKAACRRPLLQVYAGGGDPPAAELREIQDTTGLATIIETGDQDAVVDLADLVVVRSMDWIERIGRPYGIGARSAAMVVSKFTIGRDGSSCPAKGWADCPPKGSADCPPKGWADCPSYARSAGNRASGKF